MEDEIRFDWDNNKALSNIEKHNITFEEAATTFSDERAILFDDPEHSEDEERFLLIGMSYEARVLIVSHCYRGDDNIIRIISARKATKTEKEFYKKGGNL